MIYLSLCAAIREDAVIDAAKNTEVYEVTAYTIGDDYTPSHGITASGKRVERGDCACPPHMPFGTRIYIPEMNRTYTCADRGGSIKGKRLDIYVASRSKAMDFGRRRMEVEIISE